MKRFEIEYLGEKVLVEAKVESYKVRDLLRKNRRGLCVKLVEISQIDGNELQVPNATITKSFEEFIEKIVNSIDLIVEFDSFDPKNPTTDQGCEYYAS